MKTLRSIQDTAKAMLIEHGPTHAFSHVEKKVDTYVKAKNDLMADYYFLVLENLYETTAKWGKK